MSCSFLTYIMVGVTKNHSLKYYRRYINFSIYGIVHFACVLSKLIENALTMDDLRFRLNFNLSTKNEIYHHS